MRIQKRVIAITKPRLCFIIFFTMIGGIADAVTLEDYPGSFDPDPNRLASEVEELTAGDSDMMPPTGAIVAVGSSTMKHWEPRIREDLDGLTVIPRGFGGSMMSDVIYFADELISKYEPRAVLLYEGENDSSDGKSPEAILEDFKFLVELCRTSQPELRFYVISIKPSFENEEFWPQMEATNALLESYCAETEGLVFIDASSALTDANGNPLPDIFMSDGLHLNEKGYDLLAGVVAPRLLDAELTFEGGAETWAGFPVVDGFVNTEDWLGWLNVEQAPWIYSYSLAHWMYLPEESLSTAGGWSYMPRF